MIVSYFLSILLLCYPAYAYIDPGAGSFMIQFIVAGISSVIAGIALWKDKIFSFFKRRKPPQD